MSGDADDNGDRGGGLSDRALIIQARDSARKTHAAVTEFYMQMGALVRELGGCATGLGEAVVELRRISRLPSQRPAPPPASATATVFPIAIDKQQSYADLEAMSRQAASILDVDSGNDGENTKITRMTSNVQVLQGIIEDARGRAYNRLQRTTRLKAIGVWIGIIGGGIPILLAVVAAFLWVLRFALTYLKIAPP